MKIFINHDYIVSQLLHYRLNKFVTIEQNFVNLMTQHKTEEVCSVDNTRSSDLKLSSKQPNATST
jgi:hypothetical protein